jgi:hypothetical protein
MEVVKDGTEDDFPVIEASELSWVSEYFETCPNFK